MTQIPSVQRMNAINYGKNEHYAAAFLGVSVATIRRWRREGRGPRFKILGRKSMIRYAIKDLQEWWDLLPAGGAPVLTNEKSNATD